MYIRFEPTVVGRRTGQAEPQTYNLGPQFALDRQGQPVNHYDPIRDSRRKACLIM